MYTVNAMLIWGGGYWGHEGALDYSGGYVIHLAAGTSGFVAAWMIGPRLARDRARFVPHSLPAVSIGAGILWLGWNGFNGGDPYFASADAATAVVNTNVATAAALLTWVVWDMFLGKAKKPTFLGAVNGMIVGLVAITPAAGYVNGMGALFDRDHRLHHRVVRLDLHTAHHAALRRRRHGRGLHPRARRPVRRYPRRGLRRPGRDPVRQQRVVEDGLTPVSFAGALYGHPKQVWIQFLAGAHDHRLRRHRHVHHPADPQGRLPRPADVRRGARDRRPGHPRRGGLPADEGYTRVSELAGVGAGVLARRPSVESSRDRWRWLLMMLVTAVIKPFKLDDVKDALEATGSTA